MSYFNAVFIYTQIHYREVEISYVYGYVYM